ncbi:MAG TPA: hypothetical protein VHO95_01265, partial [Candidatus Dormibacteraeota bacterium]|nr:hypothetical protein [Candidatus Dormibacteraeota bacterium]
EFAVITPSAIFASKWSTTGPTARFVLLLVQRIDLVAGSTTDWFSDGDLTVLPIGSDASGNPIIAAGTQLQNGRMSAQEIWIVPQASTGPAPAGRLLYSDGTNPLTILGSPIVSRGAIWIETDHGLWLDDSSTGRMKLVSPFSGFIAGGCT